MEEDRGAGSVRWSRRAAGLITLGLLLMCIYSLSQMDVKFVTGPSITDEIAIPTSTADKVFVHLLGQQRTGSSFVGAVLDRADDIFFLYEPLIAIYSSMFGFFIESSPNDIFFLQNGTRRTLSETEMEGMEMVLRSVATCSLSTLPTSFLLHTWWSGFATNMTNVFGYISCLEISGIHAHHNYLACVDRYLSAICPRKFDPNDERTWICADYLWYGRKVARPGEANFKSKTEGFLQCVDKFAIPIKSCAVNHLDSVCASKSVRAIKTVRMTLTDTLQVMDRISSDYRIISLTREPIGVINSRVKGSFAQGFYERQNVSRMAELYCQMSVEIHNSQTNLPMKIRTMEVSHAQVVAQPIRTFSEIFEFIGMLSIPDGSRMFLEAARRRYSAKSQDPYPLEFVRQVKCACLSYLKEQETAELCS